MRKFIFPLVCLVFFIACLPNKKLSKLPKCTGQYVATWCDWPQNATTLELYDDSTFLLAGSLSLNGGGMPRYFLQFKGTYRFLSDSLLLNITYRQHNYYELEGQKEGIPNLTMWGELKNFANLSSTDNYEKIEVILLKNKKPEENSILGKNGYFLETKGWWYLSEPAEGINTIHLMEVDYLPPSFFQKHPNLIDTSFYKTLYRYCRDSIGKRIDRHRFGG